MWCNRDKDVTRSETGKGTESEGVVWKERVFLLYEGDQGSYPHKVRREQDQKGEERDR